MANHASAEKRIRNSASKRLRNRYYARTTRNAVKALRHNTNKSDALKKLPGVISMVDKLAKRNVIHKNKASNIKSGLTLHVNKLV
jgi:small subunit ribosomal protein S20